MKNKYFFKKLNTRHRNFMYLSRSHLTYLSEMRLRVRNKPKKSNRLRNQMETESKNKLSEPIVSFWFSFYTNLNFSFDLLI